MTKGPESFQVLPIELERRALRLLCSNLIRPVTRAELASLLDGSVFADPLNRVVFEEIQSCGEVSAAAMRGMLPSRITNRGFPDFELGALLEPNHATEAEIEQMFSSVLSLIELRHKEEEAGEGGKKKGR